jgi:hypothetical protein
MKKLSILIIILLILLSYSKLKAQNHYIVTLNTDHYPALNGEFRWAINQANAHPGLDYIDFNIPLPLPIYIHVTFVGGHPTDLSSDPIIIDGNTQPGIASNGDKKIVISSDAQLAQIFCNSATIQSQIKNIRFFSTQSSGSGRILAISNANNIVIQNCIFHHSINSFFPCDGIYNFSSSNVKYIGNVFGTDNTLSNNPNLGFVNSIVFTRIQSTYPNSDNNVVGGILSGEPNYFYNSKNSGPSQPLSIPKSCIYGDFGINNKISGNLFIESVLNIAGVSSNFNNNKITPVITSVSYSFATNQTIITGVSPITNVNQPDNIELFVTNNSGIDAIQYFGIGSSTSLTNWTAIISGSHYSKQIIATATDFNGNTSQFSAPFTITVPYQYPCKDCIGSFAPIPGQEYVLSAWVKEENAAKSKIAYDNPKIQVQFLDINGTQITPVPPAFSATGDIIDTWQRVEEKFTVPATAVSIKLDLSSVVGNSFFDDIRVFPSKGNMKSYVYDPITQRLVAELDERNYATKYDYDEEGKLVRIKKETERGVMTVKESRQKSSRP